MPTTTPRRVLHGGRAALRRSRARVVTAMGEPARRLWRAGIVRRAHDVTAATAGRSCLVLAPHPDDETLGCGATILRKRAAGTDVHVLVASDGRRSHRSSRLTPAELAEIRAGELQEAAHRLGLADGAVTVLGLEDGRLHEHHTEMVDAIVRLVGTLRPDEVFVPSELDPHPDHQALAGAASVALATVDDPPRTVRYPVWYWAGGPWTAPPSGLVARAGYAVRAPFDTFRQLDAETVRTGAFLVPKRHAIAAYRSQTTNLTGERRWPTLPPHLLRAVLGRTEVFFRGDGVTGG